MTVFKKSHHSTSLSTNPKE
jgi:hypothetical protein